MVKQGSEPVSECYREILTRCNMLHRVNDPRILGRFHVTKTRASGSLNLHFMPGTMPGMKNYEVIMYLHRRVSWNNEKKLNKIREGISAPEYENFAVFPAIFPEHVTEHTPLVDILPVAWLQPDYVLEVGLHFSPDPYHARVFSTS